MEIYLPAFYLYSSKYVSLMFKKNIYIYYMFYIIELWVDSDDFMVWLGKVVTLKIIHIQI